MPTARWSQAPFSGRAVPRASGDRYSRLQATGGSGNLASHDPRVHFGLADSDAIAEVTAFRPSLEVTVRWIDGSEETFGDFAAGQTIVLRQGSTARE